MSINTSKDKINFKDNKKNNSNNPNNANNSNGITVKPQNNFNNKFNKRRNKKNRHKNAGENPENKNVIQQPPVNQTQTVKADKPEKPAVRIQTPKEAVNNNKKNIHVNPYKIHQIYKNKNQNNNNYNKKENKNPAKKDLTEDKKPDDIEINQNYQIEEINVDEPDDLDSNILKKIEKEETGPFVEIVGIRYKPVGKIYFFAPNNAKYSANEKVIVETSRGLELGYIAIPNKNISVSKVVQPLKQVLRKASEDDIERAEKNKKLAKETIKIANDRIKFFNLENMKMKLIEAEYTFDNSKLIYYFTADGRVDFRELVKDLAAIFKTRIEMRQIGIRDQTKILGGLSICGRPFCCNSFLQDLAQVTIKMAKEQNMPINSAKMSGACGKLMCCLKYEHEAYEYLSKDTPKVNSIVETSSGETGVVIDSNLLTGICKIKITQKNNAESDNTIKPFPKKNLKIIGFMKNEQEHLYKNGDKESETEQA